MVFAVVVLYPAFAFHSRRRPGTELNTRRSYVYDFSGLKRSLWEIYMFSCKNGFHLIYARFIVIVNIFDDGFRNVFEGRD
jgi:hypothetical protein